MKTSMIYKFIEQSQHNQNIALIYYKNWKFHQVTFEQFYKDCLKMKFFLSQRIDRRKKVLLFSYPYSYYFYVAMFAGFMSGLQLVILDSYGDRKKIKLMVNESACEYVLIDNMTKYLAFKIPNKLKRINISRYKNCEINEEITLGATVTTFTSGTTGNPKRIERGLDFLAEQVELIKDNMNIEKWDLVYGMMPMYSLLSLFLGNATCISRKITKIEVLRPTVLLTPIRSILNLKKEILSVKKCFLGGAIIYNTEVKRIKSFLPNACINYVYGASEGALIYQTDLEKYVLNPLVFETAIAGVHVKVMNQNGDGVGEIAIEGKTVISSEKYHLTGDYGCLENGCLKIVGRKKFSNLEKKFYNYILDDQLLKENKEIRKLFSFYYGGKVCIVYEGQLTIRKSEYEYYKFKKLPMDMRHKTKLDYAKAIEMIKKLANKSCTY